ncbi:GNAT family N-acetyltransferase [Streptomyces specialis]|uniref:GNAT family N-acetyltransferase n=1 Tax=Streptomyces specialis TaxID=498367 RepID=UPI000B009576|nr:GNAT family N-acetyltransferase [Streptomyces specialis]
MTERRIYLDPDPRDRRSRRIDVRASRWYASVVLNRDEYVYAATQHGRSPELPSAYTEAIDRARSASMDRICYDGYSGGFSWGNGPSWITLFVQFSQVDTAVEALRAAELDHDYSKLHALADSLALPVDDWLAPGERELVRGVHFHSPPSSFLNFLRSKASGYGLRLNARATAGSVWVRPTLPDIEKMVREKSPEQYPGWVDRWTGYIESDTAPIRPWVGGREQDLSYGASPVQFHAANVPTFDSCRCGKRLQESSDDGKAHAAHHTVWEFGIRAPKNLMWLGELAVVTTESPITWRRLAYKVARWPQVENHYDFRSWSHIDKPEVTQDNFRSYLLRANDRVIGYLAAHDTNEHRHWDLDGSRYDGEDNTLRPRIILIWVAGAYRHQGIGGTLVRALADDFGCKIADVSWSSPISPAGRRLARRLSPEGVWVS